MVSAGVSQWLGIVLVRDGKVAWRLTLCKCREASSRPRAVLQKGAKSQLLKRRAYRVQVRRLIPGFRVGEDESYCLLPESTASRPSSKLAWMGWPGEGRARRGEQRVGSGQH